MSSDPEHAKPAPKPDPAHLKWAIDQRSEIQRTILALYNFLRGARPENLPLLTHLILDQLGAAAFSLWRAVFLAETFRDEFKVLESMEAFLEKVITDNAINFTDDKKHREWTVGYYLENAKLRLADALTLAEEHLDIGRNPNEVRELVELLRTRRPSGVGLTRYEWEAAHYVLRRILMRFEPLEPALDAIPPEHPKPEGLEALFATIEPF